MKVHCAWCGIFVREKEGDCPDSEDSICHRCFALFFPREAALRGIRDEKMERETAEMERSGRQSLIMALVILALLFLYLWAAEDDRRTSIEAAQTFGWCHPLPPDYFEDPGPASSEL